jgi:protein-glutamine gamma-glutamyltransferase
MDLDQTFSRIAFYQVLMGVLTFCYAEANPVMLLVAGSLLVLSRYMSEGPWGRPMPRWVVNSLAVVALGWMGSKLALSDPNVIVTMGHFTMWLQVLVMFARKSNREYGHVLILSLLQMIGASVLSVSIIYGLLLAVYCVLAMLTLLVFHLKSGRDSVYEANRAAAADKRRVRRPKQVVGRGFHWQFRSAVATLLAGSACVAVCVFILVPRSPEAALTGGGDGGLGPRQVGFSQQVRLDGPPIAQGSKEPVMNVRIVYRGETEQYRSWLMRGAAMDRYDPEAHTWKRSTAVSGTDRRISVNDYGLMLAHVPPQVPMWHARVTLRQIGHRHLFTILPVTYFDSKSISSVVFSREDLQLSSGGSLMGAVIYDIHWPLARVNELDQRYQPLGEPAAMPHMYMSPQSSDPFDPRDYARGWPIQTDRIASFTRSILAEAGLERDTSAAYGPQDAVITQTLANYLRDNYSYELTGSRNRPDTEPIIEFLFGHRTGHCELFASALAAMTRSIGMQSRMVTGFLASEFNQIGGYYVVRQSDAHAWVEVNLGPDRGWHSYDPTPAAELDRRDQWDRTWKTVLREAYEHIEFGWIRSIVAYDVGTRHALLSGLADKLKAVTSSEDNWLGQAILFVKVLPTAWELDKVNTSKVLGSSGLALIITAALIRSVIRRRRRLAELKLTELPTDRQRDLAKRLFFYIEMTDLLARHGHVRPTAQNPRDYALALVSQQPDGMAPVLALTDLFYRVRFGGKAMDPPQRRRVRVYLRQLQRSLPGP